MCMGGVCVCVCACACCGILYTVTMCCIHWFINKAALAYGKPRYSQAGNSSRDTGEEGWSLGDANQLKETRHVES